MPTIEELTASKPAATETPRLHNDTNELVKALPTINAELGSILSKLEAVAKDVNAGTTDLVDLGEELKRMSSMPGAGAGLSTLGGTMIAAGKGLAARPTSPVRSRPAWNEYGSLFLEAQKKLARKAQAADAKAKEAESKLRNYGDRLVVPATDLRALIPLQ